MTVEEAALLAKLPSSLRDRIKVAGEHWAWHGVRQDEVCTRYQERMSP